MKKPLFEEQPGDEEQMNETFGAFDNKLYEGSKGHLLLQLQKSYRGDERFKMDNRFSNDIESKKITSSVKGIMDSKDLTLLDKVEKKKKRIREKNRDDDEIIAEKEKDKAFQILSEIVPQNEVFLKPTSDKKRFNGGAPGVFMMKRFDPSKKESKEMLLPFRDEKKKVEEEVKKNVIKIESGVKISAKPKISAPASDPAQPESAKLLRIGSNWKNISSKKNEDKGLFFLDFGNLNSQTEAQESLQFQTEVRTEKEDVEMPVKKRKKRKSSEPIEEVSINPRKTLAKEITDEQKAESKKERWLRKQEEVKKRIEDKLKKKKKEEKFLRKQKSKYMGAYGLDEEKTQEYLRLQDLIKKSKNKSVIR